MNKEPLIADGVVTLVLSVLVLIIGFAFLVFIFNYLGTP